MNNVKGGRVQKWLVHMKIDPNKKVNKTEAWKFTAGSEFEPRWIKRELVMLYLQYNSMVFDIECLHFIK